MHDSIPHEVKRTELESEGKLGRAGARPNTPGKVRALRTLI